MTTDLLRFPTASNFRDLGGYLGADGRGVRRGRLLRSDHLGALDARDAQQISALGIKRVLDFRGVDERTLAACVLPGVTVHSLAIEPTIVQVLAGLVKAGSQPLPDDVVGYMQDTYRGFVRGGSHRFAEFFAHLLASDEPLVFHCTAGKDRTGFAAALVLHALGVQPDEVMRDYLLTNERFRPPRHWDGGGLTPEAASVLWGVRPAFLQAAYEALEKDYGGVDAYLQEGLSVGPRERERLRELYLDPAV